MQAQLGSPPLHLSIKGIPLTFRLEFFWSLLTLHRPASSGLHCVRPLHAALYDTPLGIRSAPRLAATAITHDLHAALGTKGGAGGLVPFP